LFLIYGACFGIELTVNGTAALYFFDYFDLGLVAAGLTAAAFGLMNIFARTLGGLWGDNFASLWGLKGRATWLFIALFCEGLALMLFSQMHVLFLAIPTLILFSLFTQMSEGATYSVVPFISKKSLGAVAGVVGAGGNVGAVAAGFLFKGDLDWHTSYFFLGIMVTCVAFLAFFVRFNKADEEEAEKNFGIAHTGHRKQSARKHLEALGVAENDIEAVEFLDHKKTHAKKRLEAMGVDMSTVKLKD
jgi:NNP family nitrate/nitrite transporter-like MFS transporter